MRVFIISLTLLVSASLASTAAAEPYIGIGVGNAYYEADLSALGGGDFKDNGTATKLYGGYSFSKYFAAEATLYNFAEASVGALEVSHGVYATANVSMTGVGAYAVGMYPLSKQVNLMAKLGVLDWDAELSVNNTSGENSGTDAAYGVAASYAFTKALLATLEWEYYNTDNPELTMLSLGFRFVFR